MKFKKGFYILRIFFRKDKGKSLSLKKVVSLFCLFFFLKTSLLASDFKVDGFFDVAKDMIEIASSLPVCAKDFVTDRENFMMLLHELADNITKFLTLYPATLLLKKDYPTVCHVLSQDIIESYLESIKTSRYRGKWYEIDVDHHTIQPSYYWPVYFVEVSQKGNDSHPSLAKDNLMYSVNRKIASGLSKFLDTHGAITLTAFVTGGKALISNILPGAHMTGDSKDLMRAAVLAPLERERIRSNQTKNEAQYEVNMWPVGGSAELGRLTVCSGQTKNPIGFSWGLNLKGVGLGVPITCPVAMSQDVMPYWDTGMFDYIDPNSVAGIKLSQDPVSCVGAQAADTLSESASKEESSESLSQKDEAFYSKIKSATSDMKKGYRGLLGCSFPMLGVAEALAAKALDIPERFSGPYCTVWGPIVPRNSTVPYNNDYAFANSALKFKLLAHELFGLFRPHKERWSLAYPWEGKGEGAQESAGKIKKLITGIMQKFKLNKDDYSDKSRSETLFLAGDPRLVDTSFTLQESQTMAKNFAKEAAYIGALTASSVASRRLSEELLKKTEGLHEHELVKPDDTTKTLHKKIDEATEGSAQETDIPIYKEEFLCHKSQEHGKQLLYGQGDESYLGFTTYHKDLPYTGPSFPLSPIGSSSACFSYGGFNGKTKGDINDGLIVFYKHMKKIGTKRGYRKVVKVYKPQCHHLGNKKKRYTSFWDAYTEYDIDLWHCEDKLVDYSDKINAEILEKPTAETVKKDSQVGDLVKNASTAAPWVAAELARAKSARMTGTNILPGKKRVYTIWQKVECDSKTTYHKHPKTGITVYESCEEAVRYAIYKKFQLKYLRKFCDNLHKFTGTIIPSQRLGAGFKE